MDSYLDKIEDHC
ncbi:unnamed protein product [Acanthoscelides obtectus]|uniref:Uncharacterized protein n=1 Tax=Acanthoscelides obtectus TaxID=200917 RepID=A0A9P0KBJ8_ACAOB|nr:unnamed protein product [Acanthoscelides obtectus]CAK1656034.1 hypothetical protein AOBTE_LOCUS19530 [Acanthoscelides obtectus]